MFALSGRGYLDVRNALQNRDLLGQPVLVSQRLNCSVETGRVRKTVLCPEIVTKKLPICLLFSGHLKCCISMKTLTLLQN